MYKNTPSIGGRQGSADKNPQASNQKLTNKEIQNYRQQALIRFKELWTEEMRKAFFPAFTQGRSAERAINVVKGMLFSTISGTITDSIRARDNDQIDPSADIRALSRMTEPQAPFEGVFVSTMSLVPAKGPVVFAIDDTVLPKRGKKLALVRLCHNALAPVFQPTSLMLGHSVFHGALVIPDRETQKPLAITVAFEIVEPRPKALCKKKKKSAENEVVDPALPKGACPSKKRGRSSKEEAAQRKEREAELRRRYPTSPDVAVAAIKRVRGWMDKYGMKDRLLLVVGDGSYTNATVFFQLPDRCQYVGRVRPDASFEVLGKKSGRGFQYGPKAPKPFEMATDDYYPTQRGRFVYGADARLLRFKDIGPLTRKNSTKKLQLRLLLLRPSSYMESGRRMYSHEACLLTINGGLNPETLIQAYLARWSIEVNHRNSKTNAMIGKAQPRSAESIRRVHPAVAAGFALLWVSILKLNGGSARTELFAPQSLWQRRHFEWRCSTRKRQGKAQPVQRASAVDVLTLFREAFFARWRNGLPRAKSDQKMQVV